MTLIFDNYVLLAKLTQGGYILPLKIALDMKICHL